MVKYFHFAEISETAGFLRVFAEEYDVICEYILNHMYTYCRKKPISNSWVSSGSN